MMRQTVPVHSPSSGAPSPPTLRPSTTFPLPVGLPPTLLRPSTTFPCTPVAWSPIHFHHTPPTVPTPQQSAFGPRQPTFGPHQPTFSPHQPTFSPHPPAFSPHQPAFGPQQQPTFGPHQPAFSPQQQPTFGPHQPAFGPHQPAFHADDGLNDIVGMVPLQPSLQIPSPAYFDGNGGIVCLAAHAVPTNEYRPVSQYGRRRYNLIKYDTKQEKFRKYLEQAGILSAFTNSLTELYQDPVKPINPMKFIEEKLNGSRPETYEISNLQYWCTQYQMKIEQLQTKLNHVIERLRKHEPYYNTDDSFSNNGSLVNALESCVSEVSSQGQTLKQSEENGFINHYDEFMINNQRGDNYHQ